MFALMLLIAFILIIALAFATTIFVFPTLAILHNLRLLISHLGILVMIITKTYDSFVFSDCLTRLLLTSLRFLDDKDFSSDLASHGQFCCFV